MRNLGLITFCLLLISCFGMQGCAPKFFKIIPNNFAKEFALVFSLRSKLRTIVKVRKTDV